MLKNKIMLLLLVFVCIFSLFSPLLVDAASYEYDVIFKTDKVEFSEFDYSIMNRIKVAGYQQAITNPIYLQTHEKVESYNEFYLNNGYFIALAPDGNIGIYFDFNCDYIEGSSFYSTYGYGDTDNSKYIHNKVNVGYYYDVGYSFFNESELKSIFYDGYYGWIDLNVNNSDFPYEYTYQDLNISNDSLPDLYYPIYSTNRSVKWVELNQTRELNIYKFLETYITKNYDIDTSALVYLPIKSLNSEIGGTFRHPYSTEETDPSDNYGNKTSMVFSINSSDYSSLKIKYNVDKSLKLNWWENDWIFAFQPDKEYKEKADWLNIEINSTSSISYPRRYSGRGSGSDIEYTKELNDFGDSVLSSVYKANITSLGGSTGVVSGYFDFDLRDLPDDTIITILFEYDSRYVSFEPIELPEGDLTEYDMTGKYAIGLVPKFVTSNNNFSLLYQGIFTTYYAFNADVYNVKDAETISSSDSYSKKILSFSNFSDSEKYEKPIFYMINNNSTDSSSVAKIKYNATYFELLVYNTAEDVMTSTYTGHIYGPPGLNYNSTGSGLNDDTDNNIGGINFDLNTLLSELPKTISTMGLAFTSIGQCVFIAFSSLPELVQAVLIFSLTITVIFVAIKLIRG